MILLSMLDGSFALQKKFKLDHILRAASEAAKDDPGSAEILAVMEELALADDSLQDIEIATPQRYCLCAAAPAVAPNAGQDCNTTCPDGSTLGVAYALSAQLPYSGFATPGVQLFTLTSSLTIQVK
ncbi:hypothetical protein M8756_14705 [Lutimaribacter sp. EGI FJ00015]|uniref:Uncharacterized protein n=2 Tax=Lutimaribacter degradans TaxID=2945989 RepID=A0ACC6A172_9RHOB|nr:hypothetical protein [Lutimaribacter sp. EGI FJ00013]MCO0614568.1 hypothetical protein [Lutimaribacter sp. EGI FJ00015]